MTSPLVRWTFAVLVLATIAAFFVTQQLKGEVPVVLRFATNPPAFSPNRDGFRDTTRVGFDLSEPATVTFDVINPDGNRVRRLLEGRRLRGDRKYRFPWDGRDDEGARLPDGNYRLRIIRVGEGRILDSIKDVRLDTVPPRPRVTSVSPNVISPGNPGERPRVVIRYRGPRNQAPEFRVFRTDEGPPRVVLRFRGNDRRLAVWNGYLRGHAADDGGYTFTVRVRDRAGNEATAPRDIPTPASTAPRTGVAVRHLTLTGPLEAVAAGSMAHLRVGPGDRDRTLRFALSRLGEGRPLNTGERLGTTFRVRIPDRASTGLYLVRVRSAGRRAVWPVAVTGLPLTRQARSRPRPLVVLPVATWQGDAATDSDLDGFADTLASGRSLPLDRTYPRGGLPPRFGETAGLLRFLDRRRLPYDLTSDLSLARGQGPALGNAPGVALAGSEVWLPRGLDRRLRAYVEDGGRVANFGAGALRRRVTVGRVALRAPSGLMRSDIFGERLRPLLRTSSAPLVVERDDLGLFAGDDRFVGDFRRFEPSAGGPRPASAAGRPPGAPAFVGYHLGAGTVVRVGTPQWAHELAAGALSEEVQRVTIRIWRLLGRSR
jgi:FlgD Ig-like domain